ncbi:MAG: DUF2723 domain-containing protein [Bacteroidota bacterium]
MKLFQKLNNYIGWAIFILASLVYILTSEPTASFWDCGEYIATAVKLQVGHPPGAPTFQLIGRFFSLFAPDAAHVARMVNTMSALCSGLTILFLFWSLTMLIKKVVCPDNSEMNTTKMITIFGGSVVGALAYTFSDTFWFSAVEGEVYAMSSFFTALVFWAMLKWEAVAFEKGSFKWLIFIAYMVGLSIGVHLLNLLTIPAMVFIYYFKTRKSTLKGIIYSLIISILLLAAVLYGIIPWIVNLAGIIEIFFVNTLGLPFNSGTVFYFLLLIGGLVFGIYYTQKKAKVVLNTVLLSFAFILIGYSTFLILVIRSNANTPIDENNPEDAVALLSYLNREQYGDTPLFHGQYYNAPVIDMKDGSPFYVRDSKVGKYVVSDTRKSSIPIYDPKYTTIFPRMWSNQQDQHAENYKEWAGIKGDPDNTKIPTFGENLTFFRTYQLGYMYFRYFMWNFAGRQNDIQGFGGALNGNWISGIKFIDEARLGPQDNIPESYKNKGTNKLYFLPLILGLIGLFYHIKKDKKNAFVIGLLFLMTGLAIEVFLNMYAFQPRERDYAFAASFYAFAMWIGFGVAGLIEWSSKKMPGKVAAVAITLVCLLLVPGIMAKEEWNDHDRSERYTVLAIASNYLNSCAPNSILFTNGDNDTFPLWYCQEVEGIRTDVRVCNLSLLNTDWYVDQMKRKAYLSDPLPITMTKDQYKQGTRDYMPTYDRNDKGVFVNLKDIISFVTDDNQQILVGKRQMNYFPTNKFSLPVNVAEATKNGAIPKGMDTSVVSNIEWTLPDKIVQKNHIMMLDILAHFDWKRPVYFAVTTGADAYIGLEPYFQLEGLAYHLVPIKTTSTPDGQTGRIQTDVMYNNLMNKFYWGNLNKPGVYLSEDNTRLCLTYRNLFGRLANALILEDKKDSAMKVLDRCIVEIPDEFVPYNYFILPIAEGYYKIAAKDKANKIVERLITYSEQELKYYYSFSAMKGQNLEREKQQSLAVLQRVVQLTTTYNQDMLNKKASALFNNYYKMYANEYGGK